MTYIATNHNVERIDTKRCRAILGYYKFDNSYERCDSPDHTTENHPKHTPLTCDCANGPCDMRESPTNEELNFELDERYAFVFGTPRLFHEG